MNLYAAPVAMLKRSAWIGTGILAFVLVVKFAVLASLVAPAVAHINGAPGEFTRQVLAISLMACIPFGVLTGWSTARYATGKGSWLRVAKYFAVLLLFIPLTQTPLAGPMLDYTALVYACTVLFAIVCGKALRRS